MSTTPTEFRAHPKAFSTAYEVRAVITRVVDGDTFDAFVDLGFGVYITVRIRLKDVNTPELVGEQRKEGMRAKQFALFLLLDRPVKLIVYKDRTTFGRWVADVEYVDGDGRWADFGDLLIREGLAKEVSRSSSV